MVGHRAHHYRHVRRSLLQRGQTPQPQAVFRRRRKTRRPLSHPNQEKTSGMRRIGEPSRCSATLARLGQKISLSTCGSSWKGYTSPCQFGSLPGRSTRDAIAIPENVFERLTNSNHQASRRSCLLAGFLFDLEKAFWHHPEGSTVGSGLRCREVERAVSGALGWPRRHVHHHSKQPRKTCHQSPRHNGSTTRKR